MSLTRPSAAQKQNAPALADVLDEYADAIEGPPTAHTLASHSSLDHGVLTGLTDDDHTQYQKESEKGAASGYASLGSDTLVPQDQLGTGTQDGTKFLRDDGTWQAAGGGHTEDHDHDGTPTQKLLAANTHEGGHAAVTVRVPIDLRNPRVTTLAGNSFFTVEGLTAWDAGRWEFVKDVEGRIYGVVAVPKDVKATANAKIILAIGANATSGVTRLQVSTKAIADAESMNPSSLTAETAQDITVPGTARLRKDVTFPSSGSLGETVAADDLLLVEITHLGAHANDTLNAATEFYSAFLQIDT